MDCPLYLKEYEEIWHVDPKQAKLKWFENAHYGLFLHYGLYSLMHREEWVQLHDRIPVAEYAKLKEQFTAHNFDADYITDLALKAGMKYINITSCHHEGFCLWDSQVEPFNSVNSPCGRDLIAELAEACDRKGLGFFTYYTFMLNWRHPYFVSNDIFDVARPKYDQPQPEYLYQNKEDFDKYIEYMLACIDELLSKYKITGIWLDLIAAWYGMGEEYIPIEYIYETIRKKHPDVLISWKQGATGTEDFASPENSYHSLENAVRPRFGDAGAARASKGWEANRHKHNEVCSTVQRGCWGYNPRCANRPPSELYDLLGHCIENNCNLLLNVGPMADGSISPVHADILLQIADQIKDKGMPNLGVAKQDESSAGAF